MGAYQIKKLLHIKRNIYQNQEAAHKMGENLHSYSIEYTKSSKT
jgi:hypothetical protein